MREREREVKNKISRAERLVKKKNLAEFREESQIAFQKHGGVLSKNKKGSRDISVAHSRALGGGAKPTRRKGKMKNVHEKKRKGYHSQITPKLGAKPPPPLKKT
jgi:hypothetical protein